MLYGFLAASRNSLRSSFILLLALLSLIDLADNFDLLTMITGWENNESAAYASEEVRDSSGATADAPIRTRRIGENAADLLSV